VLGPATGGAGISAAAMASVSVTGVAFSSFGQNDQIPDTTTKAIRMAATTLNMAFSSSRWFYSMQWPQTAYIRQF